MEALDAFRLTGLANTDKRLDKAVDFLFVENPNRQLAEMDFYRKEQQSELATIKFKELLINLGD